MSLWKYLEVWTFFKERGDANNPTFNRSADVQTDEYPNYQVINNYNYKPEVIPGFHLLFGGSYGFLVGVALGVPFANYKYYKLGYRNWHLMERMCLPIIKSSVLFILVGMGCGALLEIRRIANQEFHNEYNKKINDL